MGGVLGAEVGEDGERGGLVRGCCKECDGEVDEEEEREEEMASPAWFWVVGRGGRVEVSGGGRSGKEVDQGKERIDETDLLMRDEGQN